LAGCHAKLARADHLFQELQEKVEEFFEMNPSGFFSTYDPKKREVTIFPELPGELPLEWGTIVGDFAHNLRSALDQLIWQLVLHRGGTPARRTQFPIFIRRAPYRLRGRAMIEGVARKDRGAIERLQPFRAMRRPLAGADPLAQLARLSNTDKHRTLHTARVGIGLADGADFDEFENWRPNADTGEITKTTWTRAFLNSTELKEGVPICRLQLNPAGPNPVVEAPQAWAVGLKLTEFHGGFGALEWVRSGVEHVFQTLGPEFD
jgi:hypothetical protein